MPFFRRWQYQVKTEAPQQPLPPEPDIHFPQVLQGTVEFFRQIIYPSRQESIVVPIAITGAVIVGGWAEPVFAKDFQYQSIADPPRVAAVTVDSWFVPWSEPVRQKPGLRASLQDAFETPSNPTVSFGWYSNLSEPSVKSRPWLRTDKQDEYAAPVFVSETITVDKWFAALSEPVRQKPGLATWQQRALQPDTQPQVSFSWFEWLSEPVRLKPNLRESAEQFWGGDTDPLVSFSWFGALSEPVRRPAVPTRADLAWVFEPGGEVVTVDKWHNWLSEPVRQKLGLAAQQQQFFQPDPEPLVSFGWVYPWSEPIRLKPNLREGAEQFWGGDTDPIVSFGWAYPWSEPVRQKRGLGAWLQRDLFWDPKLLEFVTPDKWFGWLSEPVRLKPGLGSPYQQAFQPDAEPTVSFGWAYPWSEPVRQKPGLGAYLQQAFAIDPFILTQAEQVSEDKWHQPWSEPVRRTGLKTNLQSDYTSPLFFVAEIVTLDKWYQRLSEPVRIKPALVAAQQPFFHFEPEPQVSIGWFTPWSEPVRLKPNLREGAEPAFAGDTEPTVAFSWFAGLSEPVRTKPGLRASQQPFFTTDAEPTVSFSWFGALSEPTRRKPIAERPAFAWGAFTPAAIADLRWFAPLSEPVRPKWIAERPALAWSSFTPAPVTDIKWFAPLSEPVRKKPGLQASQQAFCAIDTEPTVSFGWSDGLSEPVRLRQFQTAQQSSLAWSGFTPPTEREIKWFTPLSEPTRRVPIAEYLPFSWSGFTPAPAVVAATPFETSTSVTYTQWLIFPALQEPVPLLIGVGLILDATEIGDLFSGALAVGVCAQADVSIIEVEPEEADTSSVVVLETYTEVSITEIPQDRDRVPVTGVVVLTDPFGNVLLDPFGNVLTAVTTFLDDVDYGDVQIEVSIIEKC